MTGLQHSPFRPYGYHVQIQGQIDPRWLDCFDRWSITRLDNGDMLFSDPTADQAELHSLLAHIRDLNLILISVTAYE